MSILVRLADLDNESSEILGLLQANLPNLPHKRRHNWLYRTNPDGPAWVWFAIEKNTGDIVGLTTALGIVALIALTTVPMAWALRDAVAHPVDAA